MNSQFEKGIRFRRLHSENGAFVVANAWDAGTARLLASLGFSALATTSSGFAGSMGEDDYSVGRRRVIERCREIVAATDLPVSGDLEDGFGDDPATVAETIRLAAEAGLVGGSIEDFCPRTQDIFSRELAVERVQAASEAARTLGFTFTLTARAEGLLDGLCDLSEVIARLQAFQEAGADVLFAPGVKTAGDIASIVSSVDRPVNVLAGLSGMAFTVDELSRLGVKRISVGGGLYRTAARAISLAASQIQENGILNF